MSIQSEIDRIEQNVANTYAVLEALGADLPDEQTSDNLSTTAGSAKALLYCEQDLTSDEQAQALENIGLTASATELNYMDGVTSNVQTQLDSKKYWANVALSGSSNANTTPTFNPSFKVNVGSNSVIGGGANLGWGSPVGKYLWHDLFAFNVNGVPTVTTSTDGETWAATTDTAFTHGLFIQKEDQATTVLNDDHPYMRWQWYSTSFHACQAKYLNIGFAYVSSQATFDILFEASADGETWVTGFSATGVKYTSAPYWFYLSNSFSKQYYLRLTLSRTSDTGTMSAISGIKMLSYRWGNQGRGSEYEKPYNWDYNQNIYPRANDTSTLGTSSSKWKTVHASTFSGDLTGNADTASELETARTLKTNLASTTGASFDGSADASIGVTGILPVANGGTGSSSVDSSPTSGSTKMVTSGGVYSALASKQNALTFDTTPTSGSTNPVTSGGVQSALSGKMSSSPTSIELNNSGSLKNYGGFIDFHFHDSSGNALNSSGETVTSTPDYTSRIIEDGAGQISVNGVKMKSGTISGTLSGNATSATTATKLGSSTVGGSSAPIYLSGGSPVACTLPKSGAWFGGVVTVGSDGVADYGKYLDLHNSNDSTNDYDVRIQCDGTAKNTLRLPAVSGQFVVHSNDTQIGSAAKPVYIADSGAATACTYSLNADVPSDAVFTDTHYTSRNVLGSSSTDIENSGLPSLNGNVYLNHVESGSTTPTSTHNLVGEGCMDVTADGNNTISFRSTGLNFVAADDITVTAGSSTSGAYLATKWAVSDVGTYTVPTNGMTIALRTPAAGYSGGILLSIDGGTTYYPIVRQVNSLVTTHYGAGSTLVLTFNSTQTASPYTTAGTTETITGCWQIADYDSNNYAYVRQYYTTTNANYPLLFKYDAGTSTTSSYVTKYTRNSNNIYANPSTGTVTATTFSGNLDGIATKASADADGNVISDTYAPLDSPAFTSSISMGRLTNSTVGANSVACGTDVTASGSYSHAEGQSTIANKVAAHAEGYSTTASGNYAHAEGRSTTASGANAHAEGYSTKASGSGSHAEGYSTTASGSYTHAEGYSTKASGSYSHAEGRGTTASSSYAHAEGYSTTASGSSSHAEGYSTVARGSYAHAEGYYTTAAGFASRASGSNTLATTKSLSVDGEYNIYEEIELSASASGSTTLGYSVDEFIFCGTYCEVTDAGKLTIPDEAYTLVTNIHVGDYFCANSTAAGVSQIYCATSVSSSSTAVTIVCTVYEGSSSLATRGTYAHIVGNGTSDSALSNAHTLDWEGNAWFAGNVYVGSTSGTNKDEGSVAVSLEGHTHNAGDISGTLGVANGGTGATTFTSGYALIGAGTSAVTTRAITNNTSSSSSVSASTNLVTMNTLRYAINRTTGVAAANTSYTTLMARGTSLNASETTPAVNGAIAWTYE